MQLTRLLERSLSDSKSEKKLEAYITKGRANLPRKRNEDI